MTENRVLGCIITLSGIFVLLLRNKIVFSSSGDVIRGDENLLNPRKLRRQTRFEYIAARVIGVGLVAYGVMIALGLIPS